MGLEKVFVLSVLALLLIAPVTLLANTDCKDVRLDKNGGPFEKIPVYDQAKFSENDSNICFAVTASEMMDADRFYNGDTDLKQLSSPISISVNSLFSSEKKYGVSNRVYTGGPAAEVIGSGRVEVAIENNAHQNVCNQKALEKYASLIASDKSQIPQNFQNIDVSSPDNFFKALFEQVNEAELVAFKLVHDGSFLGAECDLNEYLGSRVLNKKNAKEVQEATYQALGEKSFLAQTKVFLDKICEDDHVVWPEKKVISFNGNTAEETRRYEAEANEILERLGKVPGNKPQKQKKIFEEYKKFQDLHQTNPQAMQKTASGLLGAEKPTPVGISYNSGVLSGKEDGGNHGSVLIGQRFNKKTQTCEFLVRNSYGTDCQSKRMNYKWPCESGNVWVPGPTLFSKTYEIHYLPRN